MSVPTLLYLEFARTQEAGAPFAFRFVSQDYILRGEGGTVETVRIDWNQQLLDDLAAVRLPGRDPALVQGLGNQLAAMLKSATWQSFESQILAAAPPEGTGPRSPAFILTIRSAAAEIYALPWELMTLRDTGQHLGELDSVIIRYEWPKGTPPPPESVVRKEPGRILFAWSAAAGPLPATEHLDGLSRAAAAGFLPFLPERDVLPHASCSGLTAALEAARRGGTAISVLHILCHGVAAGSTFALAFDPEGPGDAMARVDAALLRQLLAPYASMVRMVVLMACDSGNSGALGNQLGSIAQTLHRAGFAQVVASRFPLSASGSVRFVDSFYRELLCAPASVEQALLRTRAQLALEPKHLDWASIQLYAPSAAGVDSRPVSFCPYRGLLVYGPDQRRFFFGRQEEQQEILSELLELVAKMDPSRPRFQIVEGPSGVGKSSLVLAGVVPALVERGWLWQSLRPGAEPLAALDSALKNLAAGEANQRRLLVVDQLEEIFSQVPDARHAEREQFVQRLWQLGKNPEGTLSIVCTLRTDYRGHCASIRLAPSERAGEAAGPRLDSLFAKSAALHNTYVQQMTPERLRQIIELPAERVGLSLAEGLSARILQDVGTEPGALALIQHTLDQLWQKREGRILTQRSYDALGGVIGALNRHAEFVVSGLPQAELDEARRLLVRLVARPGESALYTRRCVALAALRPEDAQQRLIFEQVMNKLVEAQLLVVRRVEDGGGGEEVDVVEVAHEALIRTWTRLGQWVRAEQASMALRDQIMQWVAEWQSNAQELLTPAKLASVEQFNKQRPGELPRAALQLLDASRQAIGRAEQERARHTAELQAAKERAEEEQRRAVESAQRARDQVRIAAALEAANDPTTQAAILREVERPSETFRLRRKLLFDVLKQPLAVFVSPPEHLRLSQISSDGTLLLTLSRLTNVVQLQRLDGASAPVVLPVAGNEINHAVFFPDGTRIAMLQNQKLRIFDIDGSESTALDFKIEGGLILAISPDGEHLVTGFESDALVFSTDGRGEAVRLPGPIHGAVFSPDGTRIVTRSAGSSAHIFRADGSGEPVKLDGHTGVIHSVAFSPDGSRVVTASSDGTARIFLADGTGQPVVLDVNRSAANTSAASSESGAERPAPAAVSVACFSPDGSRVLTASNDGRVQLWDANGTDEPLVFEDHEDAVTAGCFSPDGSRIATASQDRTVCVWSLDGTSEPEVLLGPAEELESIAFCEDGQRIAISTFNGGARLYSLAHPCVLRTLDGQGGTILSIDFSPTGSHAVTLSDDGMARVFDVRSEDEALVLGSAKSPLQSVRFSPDGTCLIGLQEDGTAKLWRTDGKGKPVALRIAKKRLCMAASISGSAAVCLVSSDGIVQVVRTEGTDKPVVLRSQQADVQSAFPAPNGLHVLLCFADGTLELLPTDGSVAPVRLQGHSEGVRFAEFSRDGARLLTTSADSVTRIYSIPTGGSPPTGPLAPAMELEGVDALEPLAACFSQDGTRVLVLQGAATSIWRVVGPGAPAQLRGIGDVLTACVFSPDGQFILYSMGDTVLRISQVERDDADDLLQGSAPLGCFAVSPDGGYLLAVHEAARLYPFSPERLVARLWQATRYCLPVEERLRRLGDSPEQAAAGYEAAQQKLAQLALDESPESSR